MTLTQVLIWAIARHTADIEIWRCLGFCAIAGIAAMMGFVVGGDQGWVAGIALGAFAGYLIAGYLIAGFIYEFDLWQRIVVAVSAPVFMFLSFQGGCALKYLLSTKAFAAATVSA